MLAKYLLCAQLVKHLPRAVLEHLKYILFNVHNKCEVGIFFPNLQVGELRY